MCVYKEKLKWIKESIQSIIEQTYKDLELIIVIDNPRLDSEIKDFLIRAESSDKRIKLLFNEKNEGPSNSRNRGIMKSVGTHIALMDSDDIALPNRLETEYQFMCNNKCDCVGSLYYIVDENSNRTGESEIIKKDINTLLKYSNYLVNSTLLIKKEKIMAIGGYRHFNTCEDYDFILRLLSSGCKFGLDNEFLLSYRVSDGSRSNRSVSSTRNDYYYIQKLFKERNKKGTLEDSYCEENYKEYLLKHSGESVEANYRKVNECIQEAVSRMKNKQIFGGAIFFIKAFWIDFSYAKSEIALRLKIMFIK